ncbi:MAG: DegT/DnrJ/EryC1/StrS family aminotransferase, partial [Candidatus Paceibacterota bacterium]
MISASLGAHYSFRFVLLSIRLFWQTLIGSFFSNKSSTATINQLKKQLADKFNGQVVLTYKGRDAIQVALTSHSFVKSNDIILTQAFTCYAIEEAIIRAGAKPGFVDVGKGQVNLAVETLQRGFERYDQENQRVRAVIVQHSLGHPAEIAKIRD